MKPVAGVTKIRHRRSGNLDQSHTNTGTQGRPSVLKVGPLCFWREITDRQQCDRYRDPLLYRTGSLPLEACLGFLLDVRRSCYKTPCTVAPTCLSVASL